MDIVRPLGVLVVAAGLLGCGQGGSNHSSDGGEGADANADGSADANADVPVAAVCPVAPTPPATTHCARPWFAGQMTPAASAGPLTPYAGRVAVADFDRDGNLDAVVSSQNDAVNVFMGTGVGTSCRHIRGAIRILRCRGR
jgi:hypothetical protein